MKKEKGEHWQEMQELRKQNEEFLQATRVQRKLKKYSKLDNPHEKGETS